MMMDKYRIKDLEELADILCTAEGARAVGCLEALAEGLSMTWSLRPGDTVDEVEIGDYVVHPDCYSAELWPEREHPCRGGFHALAGTPEEAVDDVIALVRQHCGRRAVLRLVRGG